MNSFLFVFSCIFIQNIVFVQFLGIDFKDSFFKDFKLFAVFSAAIIALTTISAILAWLLNYYLLIPYGLVYLQLFSFVLIILLCSFFLKLLAQKMCFFKSFNWNLITMNSVVLGVCILSIQKEQSFLSSLSFSFFSSVGFVLVFFLLLGIQERLENSEMPKTFKGVPLLFFCISILAMVFYCFNSI